LHHERDDSTDVPTFTLGDDFASIGGTTIELFEIDEDGDTVSIAAPSVPAAGSGLLNFPGLDVGGTYFAVATSTDTNVKILDDTLVHLAAFDGSDENFVDETLKGGAGSSTFAIKTTNNMIFGNVYSKLGAFGADSVMVTVAPTADNIQGSPGGTAYTTAAGYYSFDDLVEGPYTVTASANGQPYEFLRTLTVGSLPTSGAADNDTETMGDRDLQGYGVSARANFEAYANATEISGVVVNDRDQDGNTIDLDEALAGAVMELYRDDDNGAAGMDTLVATATTDANGAYEFTGLLEGRYVVAWQADTPNSAVTVLRNLDQDPAIVTTTADADVAHVGDLPRWDYDNTVGVNMGASSFPFLFKNTSIKGAVVDAGDSDPVAGMTVSLRRCEVSTGATSPPVAVGPGIACTAWLGTTVNTTTDANGEFTFADLEEGVYEITPAATTVAGYTAVLPAQVLFLTVDNGDVEVMTFDFDAS
jgi:hypothetical protein